MNDPWRTGHEHGKKEAGRKLRQQRPTLDSRTCEGGPDMPFEHDYGDSIPHFNLDLGRAYHAPIDKEAEALWHILGGVKDLRPSVFWGLANACSDMNQFAKVLALANMAAAMPEMAEAFAGEAVDSFKPHQSQNADTAYNLILLASQDAAQPSGDWQKAGDVARRVWGATHGGQS